MLLLLLFLLLLFLLLALQHARQTHSGSIWLVLASQKDDIGQSGYKACFVLELVESILKHVHEDGACACGNAIEIIDVSPMATSLVLSVSLSLSLSVRREGVVRQDSRRPRETSRILAGTWGV